MASLAIQGFSAERLLAAVGPELTLPEARKILSGVHRRDHPLLPAPAAPVLDGVRNVALAAVTRRCHVGRLQVSAKQASAVDPFAKWVFKLADGLSVETVRIPLEKEGRFCVCVSSQAGCAQGCTYCATGKLGLLRSLQAWEIVEQVRTVRLDLAATGTPGRIHGVVFQGMGEPMANLDAVLEAIGVLSDPAACQCVPPNAYCGPPACADASAISILPPQDQRLKRHCKHRGQFPGWHPPPGQGGAQGAPGAVGGRGAAGGAHAHHAGRARAPAPG